MVYSKQIIYSFLSTIGFAVLFNIPKGSILMSGINGAAGWAIYMIINNIYSSPVAATFLAAITVGLIGEILAKHFKKPATVFIIPGIVPLVPGAGTYYTMLAIVEKNFLEAANIGTETLFIAGSIASGIIISSSLIKVLKKQR